MSIVFQVIVAILVFGLLIFVHELGHFTVGKLSGMRVNEFALGMGPVLWSRTRGETKYSLRALPIGGYVSVEGRMRTAPIRAHTATCGSGNGFCLSAPARR